MEGTLWSVVYHSISSSGGIEGVVIVALLLLSMVSWTVIITKIFDLRKARNRNARFTLLFRKADCFGTVKAALDSLESSPLSSVFQTGLQALEARKQTPVAARSITEPRQIPLGPDGAPEEYAVLEMRETASVELGRLEKGLGFLATIGSTSPFIGLFGTVWGIMSTFSALGNASSASLSVVAPGISSALIATAAGLAVAIPAVVAFNWFQAQLDGFNNEIEGFIEKMGAHIKHSGIPARSGPELGAPKVIQASAPAVSKSSQEPEPGMRSQGVQA